MSWFPWQLCGWLIALLGAPILAYTLFADRAKGRRRCPKCWYDMRGVPATIQPTTHKPTFLCPECGHTARSERALLKSRHRLKLLPLTILMFAIGYLVWSVPRYRREGPIGLVPTTFLILAAPYPETDAYPALSPRYMALQDTLHARVEDDRWARRDPDLYWWQKHLWDARLSARFAASGRHYESDEPITLGSYDVADIINRRFLNPPPDNSTTCFHSSLIRGWTDNSFELIELLSTVAPTEDWLQNGGDRAHVALVGSRLHVVASPTLQRRVSQLLSALSLARKVGSGELPAIDAADSCATRIYRVRHIDNDWSRSSGELADTLRQEFMPDHIFNQMSYIARFNTVGPLLVVTAPAHVQAQIPFAILKFETQTSP